MIRGEVALVTGGASGIGFSIARALVAEGAKVVIADIDGDSLAGAAERFLAEGATVAACVLDVRNPDSWRDVVAKVEADVGHIAILCNNAGVGTPAIPTEYVSSEEWGRVLGINLDGMFQGVRAVVPLMKARGAGHVVNTSSILGLFAKSGHAPYVTSKFAVVGLSEVLRVELAPFGIGVSVLLPGLVRPPQAAAAARLAAQLSGPVETASRAPAVAKPVGIDAEAVGGVVVDAIRHNRLYVLTHRNYEPVVRHRAERLLQAFEEAQPQAGAEDISFLGTDTLTMP